ncbi:MAG: hypothetical protein Q9N62_00775 [Ghiorsea sp.]|nr:hypothetical protein [Ghiorsea sp.]
MKKKLKQYGLVILLGLPLSSVAYADDWSGYADVSMIAGAYSGTTTKNSSIGYGASLQVDYLEWGGAKVAGSLLNISGIDSTVNYTIEQQSVFASAHVNKYCDTFGGVFTFRLDAYQVDLKDEFTYQDNVRAYAPQLSFLNYQKTFYVDLGYAKSTYANGLQVDQLTPTLGFAFNQGSDWLQTRSYLIQTSDAALAQGVSTTQAVEFKLTHWTAPGSIFSQLFANVLLGERVFAVDGDAAAVYSLADAQQGGASFGLSWASSFVDSSLMISADSYINKETNATYINGLAYINFSKSW